MFKHFKSIISNIGMLPIITFIKSGNEKRISGIL